MARHVVHNSDARRDARSGAHMQAQVAFGIFLTELGVTSDEDAMAERTADSLCGALSRTMSGNGRIFSEGGFSSASSS